MNLSIIKKEWQKCRLCLIALAISMSGATAYGIMRIARVARVKGVDHIWQILLTRDVVFIESLQYLPFIVGLVLAFVQWMPEMQQKRLKLTLHLPVSQFRAIGLMVGFSFVSLLVMTIAANLAVALYLSCLVANELVVHVLLTSAPWFVAGFVAYAMASAAIVEPRWNRRVAYLLIGLGLVRLCFISTVAGSYAYVLPAFVAIALIVSFLPHLSVDRFRCGM